MVTIVLAIMCAALLIGLAIVLLRQPRPDHGGRLDALRHDITTSVGELRVEQVRSLGEMMTRLAHDGAETRVLMEAKLREMSDMQAGRLNQMQAAVHEGLHAAVEKQMQSSFQRVIDQFTAVQKAMGDVQAVTAQIGDLRRIFSNVKARGGWGEAQLQALLDDILPPGSYEKNHKLQADSHEAVEFALYMPMRGAERPMLAVDAKFPMEDYERLLLASEAGDAEGERAARRGLETRLRAEARKIAGKYVSPPVTVEFAVMYLPTDGLYAEAARMPGLIEEMGRHKVLLLGPALLPAMLRTIQLGFVTLALEEKADEIRRILGATRTEMVKMDEVLEKLGKQAGTFGKTIDAARVRTRAMGRVLKGIEAMQPEQAETLLELENIDFMQKRD